MEKKREEGKIKKWTENILGKKGRFDHGLHVSFCFFWLVCGVPSIGIDGWKLEMNC